MAYKEVNFAQERRRGCSSFLVIPPSWWIPREYAAADAIVCGWVSEF
jgi:hypothetical protein